MDYQEFLAAKRCVAPEFGFDVTEASVNPLAKPHQKAIIRWMVKGGRRGCFASFGLGKTLIQLEAVRLTLAQVGGRGLIVIPLGVRQEFIRDAGMLGIEVRFIRRIEEAGETGIYLTNYETVRDGKLDPRAFGVASLDEAAVLRGFGGTKTFREFMAIFAGDDRRNGGTATGPAHGGVPYRFVATATPSPNEYIELLAYSAYLGILDVSAAKTRFFKRDSTKADHLTLHDHKREEFWRWVSTWAVYVTKPSDIDPTFSDEGYVLPPLDVHWHEMPTNHEMAGHDSNGQARLYKDAALGVTQAAREKRESLDLRVAKAKEIVDGDPGQHFALWHDLESERHAIVKALPGTVDVYGSQDIDERESRICAFADGGTRLMAAKPAMLGSGVNWQRHCHRAVYVGIGTS